MKVFKFLHLTLIVIIYHHPDLNRNVKITSPHLGKGTRVREQGGKEAGGPCPALHRPGGASEVNSVLFLSSSHVYTLTGMWQSEET